MGKNTIEFTPHPDSVITMAAIAAPGKYALRNGMVWQDTSKPVKDQDTVVDISADKIMIRIPVAALSFGYTRYQETAAHAKSATKTNYTYGAQHGTITTRGDCLKFVRDELERLIKIYVGQVGGAKLLLPYEMWHLQKVLAFPPSYITNESKIVRNDVGKNRQETVQGSKAEAYVLAKMDQVFHDAPSNAMRRDMILALSHRFGIPVPDELWEEITLQASEEELNPQQEILELQQKKMARGKKQSRVKAELVEMSDGEEEVITGDDLDGVWWDEKACADCLAKKSSGSSSSSKLPSYVSKRGD